MPEKGVVPDMQSVMLPISVELIRDVYPTYGMTQRELAEYAAKERAWAKRHAELEAAGLLDDRGYEIKITDCPVYTTLGNYDSTDEVRCELKRGHEGPHKYIVEWGAD